MIYLYHFHFVPFSLVRPIDFQSNVQYPCGTYIHKYGNGLFRSSNGTIIKIFAEFECQ